MVLSKNRTTLSQTEEYIRLQQEMNALLRAPPRAVQIATAKKRFDLLQLAHAANAYRHRLAERNTNRHAALNAVAAKKRNYNRATGSTRLNAWAQYRETMSELRSIWGNMRKTSANLTKVERRLQAAGLY